MITEFSRIEDLEQIRDDWSRLLAVTPQATFFQSLDWLQTYWKHFGFNQTLKVICIETHGEITGIVPLVIRQERSKVVGALKYLTYPLDHWGSFYSALGVDPHASLALAMEYLSQTPRKWDIFDLRWLGGLPDDCDRSAAAISPLAEKPVKYLLDRTALIHLPASWEEYLATRTSKWRNNLKRWRRKADELGEVSYDRYRPSGGTDADPRWDLFDTCVDIASVSWQGTSPDGTTLSHRSVQPFLRDSHAAAAKEGFLDLNLMRIDGKAVAFSYNYHFQRRLFGMRVGYDPAVRSCSAGNLLYAHVIADSCSRGDTHFDLGPGSLDCKKQIWSEVLPIYRLTYYRRFSLTQQLMKWKRQKREAEQFA